MNVEDFADCDAAVKHGSILDSGRTPSDGSKRNKMSRSRSKWPIPVNTKDVAVVQTDQEDAGDQRVFIFGPCLVSRF